MTTQFGIVALAAALAMSGGVTRISPADRQPPARFVPHTIATGLAGGYQAVVTDLNRDGRPDVLVVAADLDELRWYENPEWTPHVLARGIGQPINAAAWDVDDDGIPEVAVAHEFSTVYTKRPGVLSILTHKGDPAQPWSMKEIDRVPTSHRVRFMDVEGISRKWLVNCPLIGSRAVAPEYRDRVTIYAYRPGTWAREVIDDHEEGVVHAILPTAWDGGMKESLLTASFLGVHRLEFNEGRWRRSEIVKGNPAPWPRSGSSEVAVGHLGGERFLVTIEPWHGNQVLVYRQVDGTWSRQVIDDAIVDGHTLLTGDFDGDGRDEIIAGERQGRRSIYVYRADRAGDTWARQALDDGDMAGSGCAVADVNGDRRLDVVCVGDSTANLKWYENRQ